jgi:hypothetical protein
MSSCVESLEKQVDTSVRDLTSAADRINANASNTVDILNKIKRDYPGQIKDIINNDVDRLVKTTISATGVEFRCNTAFLQKRVQQGLNNLIIKLQNLVRVKKKQASMKLIPVTPTFCSCNPTVIDLNNMDTKKLEIYGYDFEDIDSLKIYATKYDGTFTDITKNIAKPTDYLLTLSTDLAAQLTGYNKVSFYFNKRGIYSLLIIPKSPKICEEKDWTAPPVPQTLDIMASPCGGDDEFAGAVFIECSGKLEISKDGTAVICKVHFRADEKDGDTHACYDREFPVYKVETGYKIKNILSPVEFEYKYTNNHEEPDDFGASGFVQKAQMKGDHEGGDVGQWTGATLQFANLRLTLIEASSDCIDKELYIQSHSGVLESPDKAAFLQNISKQEAAILKQLDSGGRDK